MNQLLMSALLNAAILSLPLTAAVWLALRLAPRRALSASARCIIWWTTVLAVVALPLLYLPRQSRSAAPPAASSVIVHSAVTPTPLPRPAPITIGPINIAPINIAGTPRANRFAAISLEAIWMATAAVLLLRLLLSCVTLLRLKRHASSTSLDIPLPRRARLLASSHIGAPLAAGFLRPAILVPEALLAQLNPDQLEQVVLHESAHLARRDDYALLLERAIEAVFALHPAVRFIARQLDMEREIACDDRVVGASQQAIPYAACLACVAELCGRVSLPAAAFFPNPSQLSRRIDMLLDRNPRVRFPKTRAALAVVAALAAILVSAKAPRLLAFSTPLPQLAPEPSQPAPVPQLAPVPVKAKPAPRLLVQAQRPPQPQVPPATPPVPATPPAAAAATPRRLSIVVVITQVTAHDGSFVPGLTSSDFRISQDGVQQPITHFAQSEAAYDLAFDRPSDKGEGGYKKLRIEVDRPNLVVRTRDGYSTALHFDGCWKEITEIFGLPAGSRCD